MTEILEIGVLILGAGLKFFLAPSATVGFGYSFWETIMITITGGTLGVLFFYYVGGAVFNRFFNYIALRLNFTRKKKKKKFTRKNKLIIAIKSRLGLIGLSLLTPSLLSIPLGSILAAKYFHNGRAVGYLLLSVVLWSFILTTVTIYIKPLLN